MHNDLKPPSIFSLEFHIKFFPRLLWSRLRPKKQAETGTHFSHNMESILTMFGCAVLLAIGIPNIVTHGSVVGWILAILGGAGLMALILFSIVAQIGTRPSYDNFLMGVFFFLVFLGLTVGLMFGQEGHAFGWGLLGHGLVGLLLGYVVGIFAGLGLQTLGWMSAPVDMMSGVAIVGLFFVDLILFLK